MIGLKRVSKLGKVVQLIVADLGSNLLRLYGSQPIYLTAVPREDVRGGLWDRLVSQGTA